jgi:D-arabinose 1-dehydrogenase-like Zn-dependent alcohol dehydrogenase
MAISIPKTQKAAVVEKPGKDAKAVIRDIPVEEPNEGEVLIKMDATGVCHTDLHLIKDDWSPQMTMTCPVGGHEGVGKIVKLGPGVTDLKMCGPQIRLIVVVRLLV